MATNWSLRPMPNGIKAELPLPPSRRHALASHAGCRRQFTLVGHGYILRHWFGWPPQSVVIVTNIAAAAGQKKASLAWLPFTPPIRLPLAPCSPACLGSLASRSPPLPRRRHTINYRHWLAAIILPRLQVSAIDTLSSYALTYCSL